MRNVSKANPTWIRVPRGTPRSKFASGFWQRVREGVITGYILCVFTLYLFYTGSLGYNGIDLSKLDSLYAIHLSLAAVIALSCLLQLAQSRSVDFIRDSITRINTVETLALIYLLLVWVSALLSNYWPQTIAGLSNSEGALKITIYILVFLLVARYGVCNPVYIYVLGASVSIFCLICLVQFLGGNPFNLYSEGTLYRDYLTVEHPGQFCGTIGNSNLTVLFLVGATLLLIAYIFKSKQKLRCLLIPPVILAIIVLCYLRVSLGLIGLIGGLVLAAPILVPKKQRGRALLLTSLVVLGVLLFICLVDLPVDFLHEAHEVLHGNYDASFGSGRLGTWQKLLGDMKGHWLFGHGPDTVIVSSMEPYLSVDYNSNSVIGIYTDAHNVYLNNLYCHGILAFFTYLGLLAHVCVHWVFLSHKKNTITILGTSLLGWCIASFFCITHYIVNPFFWIVLGLFESEVRKATGKR